ncbi:MAG: DUF1643 domain-containing protein [Ruminococcaceae bacterium]|nr:DUF1643 domain-containing protein [Oscillospiraceae bacterium]
MHIPRTDTVNIEIDSFESTLLEYESYNKGEFSPEDWLYVPPRYSEYRYILGTKGENPLICIGINPSTAVPGNLDNTLKSVERIAKHNGYDSFIMFNVYAERATKPSDMDKECNLHLHRENMKAFRYVLERSKSPSLWAAWGAIIEERDYLAGCVADMIDLGREYSVKWYTSGKISKAGHPHHPLYLKKDSLLDEFDVSTYVNTVLIKE